MLVKHRSQSHNALFAFLTVTLVLGLLGVIFEIALRTSGYGEPSTRPDPFFGFEGSYRAFVQRDLPGHGRSYVPAKNRQGLDQSQHFAVKKPPCTYRIFAFGGSTTRGAYWGLEGSFPKYLERQLRRRRPEIPVEVINWGHSGYGAARVSYLVRESLDYTPDLIVVYTGQNEFRDARFHGPELRRPLWRARFLSWLLSSRVLYFLYDRAARLAALFLGPRITSFGADQIQSILAKPFSANTFASFDYYRLPELKEVSPMHRAQTASFFSRLTTAVRKGQLGTAIRRRLDAPVGSASDVYNIFRQSIMRMISLAKQKNVPIIFLAKARNPQYMNVRFQYRIPSYLLEGASVEQWRARYETGLRALKRQRPKDAIDEFESVQRMYGIDYRFQDKLLHLYLGQAYEATDRTDKASVEYAKRLSARHREINNILLEETKASQVPIIDTQDVLAKASANGIVGYDFFVDSVHFTPLGARSLAENLADFILADNYISVCRDIVVPTKSAADPKSQVKSEGESLNPGRDVSMVLGWSAFNQGKIQLALRYAQSAVRRDPADIKAHLLLGYIYTKLGKLEAARQQWDTIKDLWASLSR